LSNIGTGFKTGNDVDSKHGSYILNLGKLQLLQYSSTQVGLRKT